MPKARIRPGGPFLRQSQSDFVTPALDDGSDGWWSGSQLGFVAVPQSIAAASVSLAVAIAGTFAQQEEFPFPPTLGGHETQSVVVVGSEPPGFAFSADDDVIPRGPLAEDGTWPQVVVAPAIQIPPIWDDAVPARIVEDEYQWTQPYAVPPALALVLADDDAFTPQAPTAIEEDYWLNLTSDPATVVIVDWEAGAGIALPVATPLEEEYWHRVDQRSPALFLAQLWVDPDFAPNLTVDEVYPAPAPAALVPPTATLWAVGDDIVPQAAFRPDEDYWLNLVSDPAVAVIVDWERGAGVAAPPPSTLGIDEDYWLVLNPQPRTLVAKAFAAEDELPTPTPDPVGEITGAFDQRALSRTTLYQWYIVDELPTPATPLPVDEQYWHTLEPQPRTLIFKAFSADDEIAVLGVDEQYWFTLEPQPRPLIFKAFWADDEVVTPATPLTVEESDWQVYTPPPVAPKRLYELPLFLSDPEYRPRPAISTGPVEGARVRFGQRHQKHRDDEQLLELIRRFLNEVDNE